MISTVMACIVLALGTVAVLLIPVALILNFNKRVDACINSLFTSAILWVLVWAICQVMALFQAAGKL